MKREDFQKHFAAAITRPLELKDGELDSPHEDLGLRAYHRQYWIRMFSAFQNEFPRSCEKLGAWTFNRLVEAFILPHRPTHFDLARAADGFVDMLDSEEAAWDEAWRRLFFMLPGKLWRPTEDEARKLPLLRLLRSDAVIEVPKNGRTYYIFRVEDGYGQKEASPEEARLYTLLAEKKVAAAIAAFAEEFPNCDPSEVQAWLSQSLTMGLWSGLSEE